MLRARYHVESCICFDRCRLYIAYIHIYMWVRSQYDLGIQRAPGCAPDEDVCNELSNAWPTGGYACLVKACWSKVPVAAHSKWGMRLACLA